MIKTGIDQAALTKMFSEASAKQGEALRVAVSDATLKALQGREMTMENISKVLNTITTAATAGAAMNTSSPLDIEAMLSKAFAGMDSALLQAVEANRKALQQFVDQGAALNEKPLKDALANIEKMEDTFFSAVTKAAQTASGPMQTQWEHVLGAMKVKGTETGTQAMQTVEQLMLQTQNTLREGRTMGLKTAQALLDGYAAMVSGVLIGMSEGLRSAGTSTANTAADETAKPKRR